MSRSSPEPSAARHAVVVGKFYPPHAGHRLLIERALSECDTLQLLVVGSEAETISVPDRVAWLSAEHPRARVVGGINNHPVDYECPRAWDAHTRFFASLLAWPPTHLYSSEPYGAELARRLGCEAVEVDVARSQVPISASAIRADLAAHWSLLYPAARAGLARRVVVVGAESSGTTTLTRALAERYGVAWVAEYGRTLVEQLPNAGRDHPWTAQDFLDICAQQMANEELMARKTPRPLLICDTDALATGVFHELYLERRSREVEAIAAARVPALYLVTDHEGVEWEDDGTRSDPQARAWMTERFCQRVAASGARWALLSGSVEERVAAASALIDPLLEFEFGLPLEYGGQLAA